MEFIFKTTATVKEYDRKKWWIDGNIISEKRISADSIQQALESYRELVETAHYVTITKNALKNRQPMYRDSRNGVSKQVGYVITAKTDFEDCYGVFVSKYIDLWIEIITIVETTFPEEKEE